MFVPSLAWQNDHLYTYMAPKTGFWRTVESLRRVDADARSALHIRHEMLQPDAAQHIAAAHPTRRFIDRWRDGPRGGVQRVRIKGDHTGVIPGRKSRWVLSVKLIRDLLPCRSPFFPRKRGFLCDFTSSPCLSSACLGKLSHFWDGRFQAQLIKTELKRF